MRPAFIRTWPIWLGLFGLVLLGYGTLKILNRPADLAGPDDGEIYDEDDPIIAPGVGERWAKVEALEVDLVEEFEGKVVAEGTIRIDAPAGMMLPVVKIHYDIGDIVKKGDILLTFQEDRLERGIKEAEEAGDTAKAERFKSYREFVRYKSPVDGQVVEIHVDPGSTPLNNTNDKRFPLMRLTDPESISFVVWVPSDVAIRAASLGEVIVRLEEVGEVKGSVNLDPALNTSETPPLADQERIQIALEAREGLQPDLPGVVLLPVSKKEVVLVPKSAVEQRGPVYVIRVHEDGEILERTISGVTGERGDYYIVEYGVHPGENVVVTE